MPTWLIACTATAVLSLASWSWSCRGTQTPCLSEELTLDQTGSGGQTIADPSTAAERGTL